MYKRQVFAITGLLPFGSGEFDCVVAGRELGSVASFATIENIIAELSIEPIIAFKAIHLVGFVVAFDFVIALGPSVTRSSLFFIIPAISIISTIPVIAAILIITAIPPVGLIGDGFVAKRFNIKANEILKCIGVIARSWVDIANGDCLSLFNIVR